MVFKIVSILLCILTYILAANFAARLIHRLAISKGILPDRAAFITRTLKIGLFCALFSLAIVAIGLGYGEISLFVSSVFAVVGIALFAQWSILSNLTASLIIFFAFPYRVGHRVKVVDKDDDISGIIEEIEPFHVLIRRDNGELITYPNSLILQKAVIRLDLRRPTPPEAPTTSETPAPPASTAPAQETTR